MEEKLAAAKQRWVRARLALLRKRLEKTTVRAPFDGIVLRGDLRPRVGSVLTVGEPLFQIAPLHRIKIELAVPDRDIEEVRTGLRGTYITDAKPDFAGVFEVVRIPPTSEVREGRTVFPAEARIVRGADWLRPGMEGVAKISVGRRPLWWQILHRPLQYLRMKLWL
ncbi:MAG: HlyD family secretion protein [Planctomycetota bacterium]|nr:MAG: HlyD family secretion protein [Planctomycetota bacterium]